ncbi:MAG: hypothetical protein KDD43_16605, partial [Bdellovibrionales bacterium]|nr:hypothetical protein [Bdellovibrionales bacterium]
MSFDLSSTSWSFSGEGDGTEVAPYVITDVTQLQEMNLDLEAHYVLGNNIDASETASWNEGEGFRPVGTFGKSFSGSLDGKGYQIQDLFINRPLSDNVGLFGYTEGATLDNVGIDGGSCSGDDYVGGLVGNNVSTRISHCHSAIDVNGSDD